MIIIIQRLTQFFLNKLKKIKNIKIIINKNIFQVKELFFWIKTKMLILNWSENLIIIL